MAGVERSFVGKNTTGEQGAAGEAIMQAVRPTVILASLQAGLGIHFGQDFRVIY